MFPFFGGYHNRHFESTYRAFPLAFIDKQSAEYGDKVILPPSALDRLGGWFASMRAWMCCLLHHWWQWMSRMYCTAGLNCSWM